MLIKCPLTHLEPGLLVAWQEETLVVAPFDEGVSRVAVGLNPGKANLDNKDKYLKRLNFIIFVQQCHFNNLGFLYCFGA